MADETREVVYDNPKQPFLQGILKRALHDPKYYRWERREKLYNSFPITGTYLLPSHMKQNPAYHGYRPSTQLRFISQTIVAFWEVSQKGKHEEQTNDCSLGSARHKALGCVFITNLLNYSIFITYGGRGKKVLFQANLKSMWKWWQPSRVKCPMT